MITAPEDKELSIILTFIKPKGKVTQITNVSSIQENRGFIQVTTQRGDITAFNITNILSFHIYESSSLLTTKSG